MILWKKSPKLVALFSYRFDYDMVPDLLANIEGLTDDYISWDDRRNGAKWYHEGEVRRYLIEEARSRKAKWVIGVDPDERFEKNAAACIHNLVRDNQKIVYGFRYRELWKPNEYRVDGIWGEKIRYSLFPLLSGQEFMNLPVHNPWFPQNSDYAHKSLDINLYHLKMIETHNRRLRAEIYKELDPNSEIQKIGYDYLYDEQGLKLEAIPKGREYFPKYRRYIFEIPQCTKRKDKLA